MEESERLCGGVSTLSGEARTRAWGFEEGGAEPWGHPVARESLLPADVEALLTPCASGTRMPTALGFQEPRTHVSYRGAVVSEGSVPGRFWKSFFSSVFGKSRTPCEQSN